MLLRRKKKKVAAWGWQLPYNLMLKTIAPKKNLKLFFLIVKSNVWNKGMLFFQQQSNAVTRIYSPRQLGGALLQIPKMSKMEFLIPYSLKIYARHIFFWFFGAIVFSIRFLSRWQHQHSSLDCVDAEKVSIWTTFFASLWRGTPLLYIRCDP